MATTLAVAVSTVTAPAATLPGAVVTFSATPATLSIVTNFSRSPAGQGAATAGLSSDTADTADVAGDRGTGTLSPKGPRHRDSNVATDGVNGGSSNSGAAPTLNTPSTSSSFQGQVSSATTCSYFGHGCNPPDMALAASPSFVFQGVNTQWAVYNTSGVIQPGWPVSAQNFFGAPNATKADGTTPCDVAHGSQPFISDPRATYDPVDKRFWAAELQVENALGIAPDCAFKSVFWVAVSKTSNPNNGWNVYEFNTSLDGQFANDYTQIGFNGQAFFVSANMFGPSTGLNGGFYAELFEANKAKMEQGRNDFTPDAFFNLQGSGPASKRLGPFLADTVQPVVNIDASGGANEAFVDTIDGPDPTTGHLCGFTGKGFQDSCSGVVMWKMSNPIAHDAGGPAPTLTGQVVQTEPFLVSPPQTQPSCSQCVDALDLRITGTPVLRNGVIYASWDTAVKNGPQSVPGLEWIQIDAATGNSTTGVYSFDGDGSATFGTMMPDAQGNVLMVFDHMSSTTLPEVRYIVKDAGQTNFQGPGLVLKAGESSYRPQLCGTTVIPVCRWGDYEATSFDGAGHIWFASQYANHYAGLTAPPQFGRNWSTWIGAISAS